MARLAALAVMMAAPAAVSAQWTLNLLDANKYPMAQCLDGSPGGYYFAPGSGSGANSYIIHTQGGGWCVSDEDCYGRSRSALGSSTFWGSGGCPNASSPVCYADGGAAGMTNDDATANPLFYNWNKVFINYCDGGSYAGTLSEPVTVSDGKGGNATIYYRGRYILDAVYDELFANHGLSSAANVIIKGCSAGGLAVYLHTDYVAGRIKAVNPTARVAAAPGAGFFMDVPGINGQYNYRPHYQWVFQRMNVSGSINDACVAAHTPTNDTWMCFTAPYTLPYIKTPMFISNSLADSWQAGNIMALGCNPAQPNSCSAAQIAYLNAFRMQMVAALQPVLASQVHGGFLQTCFVHVVEDVDGSWNGVQVANQTQVQTFAAWWGRSATANGKAVDGVWGSNPTCSKY